MDLRVANNYQLFEAAGRKLAVESFDSQTFDIMDDETGSRIGQVIARTDDELLAQVTMLIATTL